MFCKHCGKEIAEDSIFCKYCGTNQNEEAKSEPLKVDVNARLDAKFVPSINTSWYKKLTDLQKKLLCGYSVWFLIHLILLVSGKGHNGFFPRFYKDYDWLHGYTKPRYSYEYDKWSIGVEWDIANYGLPEFIVYIALVPLLAFIGYKMYKSNQANKMSKAEINSNDSKENKQGTTCRSQK